MPFDFPASPMSGQVFSSGGAAWQYDGEKWKGGQPAQTPTEQFFDPVGLVNLDIPVPTWAKGVQIIGSVYTTNGVAIVMRVSMDGTTFLAGASDYNLSGPTHAVGTTAYAVQANVASAYMMLTGNADSTIVPQSFTAEMNLTRPTTASIIQMKAYAKEFDSAATLLYRTLWYNGTVQVAGMGSNLAIKAIRILHGTGGVVFPAGSFVRVKWIGDAAAMPAGSGVLDAPSDGNEYVRVNGVWREKHRTVIPTVGATVSQTILFPPGVKAMKWSGWIVPQTTTAAALSANFSADGGATFPNVANSYQYAGFEQYTGTSSFVNRSQTQTTVLVMAPIGDNGTLYQVCDGMVALTRAATSYFWNGIARGMSYNSATSALFGQYSYRVMVTNIGFTALALNAMRLNYGAPFADGSVFNIEWVY